MSGRDFAKIVRASDGRQVLFYVEPSGGDYKLNQVADHGGFMATMTRDFTHEDAELNERGAYSMLERVGQKEADALIAEVTNLMGPLS